MALSSSLTARILRARPPAPGCARSRRMSGTGVGPSRHHAACRTSGKVRPYLAATSVARLMKSSRISSLVRCLMLPLAEHLVVLRLRSAEERRQIGKVASIASCSSRLAFRVLISSAREVLAELRMEFLLRHGGAREIAQRMEGAVEQVLDLQDLGVVGEQLDGAELLPGLERELEDRQRLLAGAWDHALLGNADLRRRAA